MTKFRNVSLRIRLILAFSIVFILTVVVAAVGIAGLNNTNAAFSQLVGNINTRYQLYGDTSFQLMSARRDFIHMAVLVGEEQALDRRLALAETAMDVFVSNLEAAKENLALDTVTETAVKEIQRDTIDALIAGAERFTNYYLLPFHQEMVENLISRDETLARIALGMSYASSLVEQLDELQTFAQQEMTNAQAHTKMLASNMLSLLVITSFLSLLTSMFLAILVSEITRASEKADRSLRAAQESLKKALEREQSANIAKSRFLATMSHEIRTPMNAIIGISDIELDRENQPSETRDAFDRINSSGKTLLGIINDILDLSKIETGKLELVPVKYDTPSLINDTARLNIMRIGGKPIDFIIKVSETLPVYLIGDELRIKQVLNNILSNAIKYTQQGSVTFEIASQPDENGTMLVFTVRDTGQGMTKEQLAALYEEYSMFNREVNRGTEGTGLGMSITKNLVEMMNGRIMAESEPGAGSAFTVYLLQQPAGQDVLGKEVAEKLQSFRFTPSMQRAKVVREYMPYGSVLVVDDVDANVFVAKGLMKPYGLAVDTAESGYETLEKIRAGATFDVIFMDYMMPGMDGMETAKRLREEGYTRPIIALSANAIAGMREMFCENGFDGFVSKPIDIRQLNYILNSFIRDKQPPKVLEEARRQKESGTLPASAAEEAGPLSLLKQVDGLDVDSALDAMGGLEDVYMDTVKLTARLLPDRVGKMDRFINTDWKAFSIEVHGLKSVLKNIGATALGSMAAQLERAAAEDNLPYCTEFYPAFSTGLMELRHGLAEAMQAETAEPKKTADPSALIPVIAEAKAAAEAFDRDAALEILTPCAEYTYGEETDGILREIMNALEAFQCEQALANLIKLEEKEHGNEAV